MYYIYIYIYTLHLYLHTSAYCLPLFETMLKSAVRLFSRGPPFSSSSLLWTENGFPSMHFLFLEIDKSHKAPNYAKTGSFFQFYQEFQINGCSVFKLDMVPANKTASASNNT